uniref:Phosphotransferase n=1 Tax=Schmidtea mediterranea TaxID=79327 RepID=A0A0H3YFE0_SCHMD|nr:slc25a-4 [Schmidtea mediterranea]
MDQLNEPGNPRNSLSSMGVLGIKENISVQIPEEVMEMMKPFRPSESNYRNVTKRLELDMNMGLDPAHRDKACVKMFPSYVSKVPSGKEKGQFMALDLGGTNYRILLVTLKGNNAPPEIIESTYAIPEIKMSGPGEALFDFIAETINDFLKSKKIPDKTISLGFTFSFPCNQKGLDVGILTRWTKGFSATNVEGKNVVELLGVALKKLNLKVSCKALVNDTVGTLASCSFEHPDCAIGLIVGTGSNACYIEDLSKVLTVDKTALMKNAKFIIINTEWGAFGENGTLEDIRTKYDRAMDKNSLHPGKQIFEKLISGMYLGEIVRLVLVELIEKKLLFKGNLPDAMRKPYSFLTKYMSDCERDPPHLHYSTEYMLRNELLVNTIDSLDCKIIRYCCEIVARRAAYLAGSAIAVLINKMNRPTVTIGVDGSLFRHHPSFAANMNAIIKQFKNPKCEFRLKLSEDGSGKGAAAIVAAHSF